MKKLLAVSGLALALCPAAQAYERPYIGVGVGKVTFTDDAGGDASPTVAQVKFGSDVTKMFGVQARLTSAMGEDKLAKPGTTYNFSIDSMYTLAATMRMALGDRASIYGTLGYSYAQLSFGSSTLTSVEANIDGLTYGVGIVIPIMQAFDVDVDYTNYVNGDDTLGGVTVGLRHPL